MSGPFANRKFTGWHMIMVMVAFFGVVIAVNFILAFQASKSWSGLVVQNSYVSSQHFNEELDAARKQKAYGWHSALDYKNRELTFDLRDKTGAPVVLQGLKIFLGRPAFEQKDHVVALAYAGNGRYHAATELAPGIWIARVESHNSEMPFREDFRFTVSENENRS